MNARILVADDERLLRWSLRRKCEEWGYDVVEAESREQAMTLVQREPPDLILLDVHLGEANGVEMLAQLRDDHFRGAIIIITADPQVTDVKQALRLGAFDYLCKPVNFDELEITIANALEASRLRQEVDTLRDHARRQYAGLELVGTSPAMTKLLQFVHKVAASQASTLLLQGESGTGKDLIAQIIHQHSPRRDRPFVPVNCSAIPENLLESELFGHERGAFTDAKAMKKGLFEMANGGTLFLDEVGELPLLLQSKLLRALENQTIRRVGGIRDLAVNLLVIAASNRNLEEAVARGEFREDLYYRLGVIPVFIPPLRSRPEDIPALTAFFIEQYNRRFRKEITGLTPEAEAMMRAYRWPGNVRELKNAVQRAMILEEGTRIRPDYLPFNGDGGLPNKYSAFPGKEAPTPAAAAAAHWSPMPNGRALPELRHIPEAGTSLEEIERRVIEQALRQCHGNQSSAARLLDISRDTIRYKMKKFGLRDDDTSAEA